jgi:hypothetical protein
MMMSVGVAGTVSIIVLGLVGRKSYRRKVVQLTRELEREGKPLTAPSKVWSVLTPQETIKVFTIPMAFVLGGTALSGYGLKRWCGIRDFQHGLETLRWVTKTGPPPTFS